MGQAVLLSVLLGLCLLLVDPPSSASIVLAQRGSCPSVKNQNCTVPGVNECESDSQCPYDHRCCCSDCAWKCVITVLVRSGRCPEPDGICGIANSPMCHTDLDCTGGNKCCYIQGNKCIPPDPAPPGVCPVSKIQDVHQLQCSSVFCANNGDCGTQFRCCLTDENQRCVIPQLVN